MMATKGDIYESCCGDNTTRSSQSVRKASTQYAAKTDNGICLIRLCRIKMQKLLDMLFLLHYTTSYCVVKVFYLTKFDFFEFVKVFYLTDANFHIFQRIFVHETHTFQSCQGILLDRLCKKIRSGQNGRLNTDTWLWVIPCTNSAN